MIRDLSLLCDDVDLAERGIIEGDNSKLKQALRNLSVINRLEFPLKTGDVVLFRVQSESGAYSDMETLWGDRVPLTKGSVYVGVLCERLSSKLITAEFPHEQRFDDTLDLQLIAQAGGVGWATSFSPSLKKECGSGVARDVKILGAVAYWKNPAKALNIIDVTEGTFSPSIERRIPNVLCVGTATDVGKTTVMGGMIHSFCKKGVCTAVKASGTGWFEDSLLHVKAGASVGLAYTFAGLPTTYNQPVETYLPRIRHVLAMATDVNGIPLNLLPPDMRKKELAQPDAVFVEHGGDIIEAGIPFYLSDDEIMRDVVAIVVCSESALALYGAVSLIRERMALRRNHCVSPMIFANMPLINPQGFLRRLETAFPDIGISGILDIEKPVLGGLREQRLNYAAGYDKIISSDDFIELVFSHIKTRAM